MSIARLQYEVDLAGLDRADRRLVALGVTARRATDEISGIGGNRATAAFNRTNTQATATGRALSLVGTEGSRSGRLVDRSMREASGGIGAAARSTGGLSTQLGGLGRMVAGLGLAAVAKDALGVSVEFEAAMNDVEEKLGGTVDEMEMLRAKSLEMGAATAFSASQTADAMSSLAAKGLEVTDIVGVLPDVLDLASAAQLSLEESAKLTTSTMNQFGIGIEESTRVVDLLAAVGDSSGTTIEGLGSALQKAGPAANAYGVSLESTAAVIAILADNSIEAEVAGTSLAGMFSKLMVATGDGEKALGELNLSSEDFIKTTADGKQEFIGYADAIDLISKNGASATQVSRIFGLEAGKNLVPLVAAGADAIRDMEASFKDASSAAQQAETQMKGLPGAVKNISSAWEGFQLAVTAALLNDSYFSVLEKLTGALRYMATDGIVYLTGVIDDLATDWVFFKDDLKFSDDTAFVMLRKIGDAIDGIGKFLSPVLPYLDDFGGAFASVAAGVGVASIAISGIGAAVGLLASPLVAIAALGAAAVMLYDNWDGVSAWWNGLWSDMTATGEEFFGWWSNTTLDEKAVDIDTAAFDLFAGLANDFFGWWDSSELKIIAPDIVVDSIEKARDLASEFFGWWGGSTLAEKALAVETSAIDFANKVSNDFFIWWDGTTLTEKVAGINTLAIEYSKLLAEGFFAWWDQSALKEIAPQIVVDSVDIAREKIEEFLSWWSGAWDGLDDSTKAALASVANGIDSAWGDIKSGVSLALGDISDLIEEFSKTFSTIWGGTFSILEADTKIGFEDVSAVISTAWDGIKAIISGGWDAAVLILTVGLRLLRGDFAGAWEVIAGEAEQFGGDLLNIFSGLGESLYQIGAGIVDWFADGIADGYNKVKAAAVGLVDTAKSAVTGVVDDAVKVGGDFTQGFADGVSGLFSKVKDAATEVADGAIDTVMTVTDSHSPSRVAQKIGGWFSEGFAIGITGGTAGVVAAMSELSEKGQKAFNDIAEGLHRQIIELEGGDEALRRYDLAQKEVVGSAADYVIATENNIAATRAFSDTLGQVFDAVLDGKNPLKEMEQIGKAWLRDMILTFATNKITAYFTGEGASGVSGMFDSVLGSLKGMFGGGASAAGAATTTFNGAAGALEAFGGAGAAVTTTTGAATTGLAGLSSSIAAVAGPAALIVAGVFAIGSAMTSTTRQIAAGFQFSYSAGELLANSVEEWEKKGGLFRSSDSWDILGPMEQGLNKQINQYFTSLNRSVVDGVTMLGVTGADEILSGFEVAITRITGENQGEQLADALAQITSDAYSYAFTQLAPELQVIVANGLGVLDKPIMAAAGNWSYAVETWEEGNSSMTRADRVRNAAIRAAREQYAEDVAAWEANSEALGEALQEAIEKVSAMSPALASMGLAASMTDEMLVAASIGIVDAFGSVEDASAFMSLVLSQLYTESEIAANSLVTSSDYLAGFNAEMGLTGTAMIDTRGEARQYIETLIAKKAALVASGVATDAEIAAIDDQIAASASLVSAVSTLEDETIRQTESTNALAEAGRMLGFEFDALAPSAYEASDAIIEMAGGMDEFRSKTATLYDLLYTTQQQQDIALAQAAVSLDQYNQLLGLSGDEAIMSAADLQTYIAQAELNGGLTESQTAILLNMGGALTSVNESGLSTTEILNNLDPALAGVAGVGAEATTALDGTSDGLVNLQQVTGTTTALFDAMNESVGLSGATAITSEEQLQTYIAGMEATQQTSSQAYLDAVALSEAMAGMSSQGLILNDVIDTLPLHLQEAYAAMDFAALGTSATALAAAGDVEGASTVIDAALAGVSDNLDFTTAEADVLNASLGLAGDAVITTTDQLQAHTSALDLNTVAGQTALAAIEGFVAGIDNATINTDVTTDATALYNEQVAALGAVIVETTGTTETATARNVEFKTELEGVIASTDTATLAMNAMSESVGALDASNVALMATVDQLPTNTADAFELINQQGISTGETLTASAGVIDLAKIAANESLGGMAQAMQDTATAIDGRAGDIGASTTAANGALRGFSDAIAAAARAASSARDIASRAAESATGSASVADQRSNDAYSALRRTEGYAYQANERLRNIESTGSYATGLYNVTESERIVTVHRDEMIPNADVSNQLRAMGVTHNSIPDNFGTSAPAATPIFSQPNRNDNSELVAAIKSLEAKQAETNAKLEQIKAENRQAAQDNNTGLGVVAAVGSQTATETKNASRTNERLIRTINS